MKLSIVIPACNEEARIGAMLDAYLPYFTSRYGGSVEFLVVVNGTTDQTARVVESYIPRYPGLRCIVEPERIGKGGAVRRGFAAATGDHVGYADADGATPPDAFDDLVAHAGDAPVVIASRWCPGSVVHPRQPLMRRVISRVFNLLTRGLLGLRLSDTQCGAKVLRRDVVEHILASGGLVTQWAFDVDLLLQAKHGGFAIIELPTVWHDVSGSKIVVTESSIEMLAALIRLRLLYSPFRWVVDFYNRTLGRWLARRHSRVRSSSPD